MAFTIEMHYKFKQLHDKMQKLQKRSRSLQLMPKTFDDDFRFVVVTWIGKPQSDIDQSDLHKLNLIWSIYKGYDTE